MPLSWSRSRLFDNLAASTLRLTAAGIAFFAAPSLAVIIPIVNPGFESLNVELRPGEQTSGAGGGITPVTTHWPHPFPSNGLTSQSGVIVPGWRTIIPPPNSNFRAGVLRPDVEFGGREWMSGHSGHYLGTAQGAFMQQTLSTQWQPSTTYTFSFLAGIGITDSEYSPLIGLLATPDLERLAFSDGNGVTSIARLPITSIRREQFGAMLPFTFTYTSPSVLSPQMLNHYIAISFLGSDGIPRMCYDDFRLDAVPVPASAPICLFGVASACTSLRRRRKNACLSQVEREVQSDCRSTGFSNPR